MKVYNQIAEISKIKEAVVTIGTFDGVHLAHQSIIKRLIAKKGTGETVLITFFPHPKMILNPLGSDLKLLNTLNERIEAIKNSGIDHLLIIPFSKEFSEQSSEEFTQNVLIDRIGTKKLIIGHDHRFGKNRTGGFDYLKANAERFGFEVEEIPRQEIDETTISSSKIRESLLSGEYDTAQELLGYCYSLSGKVVKGKQLGRTIGYPTANIFIEENYKLIPANGVFAVSVSTSRGKFGGMLNIGFRPTVNGVDRTIEVNIFDFDFDIYDENIQVNIIAFIRNEQKFVGLDALKDQLSKDKIASENILKTLNTLDSK